MAIKSGKRILTGALSALLLGASTGGTMAAEPTRLFWGDTHLHTGNSFDVYLFGTPTATPATAYRFAKGLPVINPATGARWQLHTPLDFLVVADHAELLGSFTRLFDGDQTLAQTKSGKAYLKMGGNGSSNELQAIYSSLLTTAAGGDGGIDLSMQDIYRDLHAGDKRRDAWQDYIDVADSYNEPGKFTTLIGFEWSSQPGGSNLHRVVFTAQDKTYARKFLPFSQLESGDPRALWAWLEKTSTETGADFVAIPHNANLSVGLMFPAHDLQGKPLDKAYAQARSKWEPVVEVTQIKGDSEAHPQLSPTDEFADFETYGFILIPDGGSPGPTEADYVRSGLKRGLEQGAKLGVNPFKAGLIGSSDSHTGISAVEESNFGGKGQHDATPTQRPQPTGIGSSKGWDMGAAGFVGVWASENTRQAIFDAFQRKEVYASTGPRIALRFFAGWNFGKHDYKAGDMVEIGYSKGVPMGGDLVPTEKAAAPQFLLAAMKDPLGANLDRVQIVKGWLDASGKAREKIFDVVWSGERKIAATGKLPAVGNTVDLQTANYRNTIGAASLAARWVDPEFDPGQAAFYYARVLEIPTPRYSLYDAIALNIDPATTGHPATIQERVYSSPIWYTALAVLLGVARLFQDYCWSFSCREIPVCAFRFLPASLRVSLPNHCSFG